MQRVRKKEKSGCKRALAAASSSATKGPTVCPTLEALLILDWKCLFEREHSYLCYGRNPQTQQQANTVTTSRNNLFWLLFCTLMLCYLLKATCGYWDFNKITPLLKNKLKHAIIQGFVQCSQGYTWHFTLFFHFTGALPEQTHIHKNLNNLEQLDAILIPT